MGILSGLRILDSWRIFWFWDFENIQEFFGDETEKF